MAYPVKAPQKGLSADSVIISEWLVEEGDHVEEGDLVLSVETNKAVTEVETEQEGVVLKIFFEEGEEVPVLTNVAVIGEPGEGFEELYPEELTETEVKDDQNDQEIEAAPKKTENKIQAPDSREKVNSLVDEDIVGISPRAKNLALEHGLDYKGLEGSGPRGRIIERDIRRALTAVPGGDSEENEIAVDTIASGLAGEEIETAVETAADYQEVPLSSMRRQIADKMSESARETARFTLNSSFDATSLLDYRKRVKQNESVSGLEDITLNDMILFVVSRTLPEYEELNAYMLGDRLRYYKNVNLGLAVHTERGLMVPTLFNAHQKSLNRISREAGQLAQKCREGQIEPEQLEGATFTVTNLGQLGIESFNPIINTPQVGILGVGTIDYKIKKQADDFIHYPAINLSLTVDHRAVDGAPAAEFLKVLTGNLEQMELILSR